MTEFRITKKETGRDFNLAINGSKHYFVTEDETGADITISYADIVRLKIACDEALGNLPRKRE